MTTKKVFCPRSTLVLALAVATVGLPASLSAQPSAPPIPVSTANTANRLAPDQLDDLLGPIALYPDALIALILPASATSSDIVLAARYLQGGGDPAQIENQPWDDSVVALAHYPDVVAWMDQNLAWTQQLGQVFVAQPVDIMQAVQRLRARAREAGTLTDTPQQQLVMEGDDISIVPTQPDVIYVPRYDPEVVYYVQRPGYYPGPFLTFGTGFSTGLWLTYDMDWGHRRVWVVDRHDRHYDWRNHRDWRHPVFPGRPGYVSDPYRHPWNPPPNFAPPRPPIASRGSLPPISRPTPIRGTPPRPSGWSRNDRDDHRPQNPRVQFPPAPVNSRPGQFPSPVVTPLQGPVVQPLQGPLVQPFRPPQSVQPSSERRGGPEPRDRDRNDREKRDSENSRSTGNRPNPPPTPPGFSNGVRPTTSSLPSGRGDAPRPSSSDNDDDRNDNDRRGRDRRN